MEQQTAVEWLYNHLFPKQLDGFSDKEWSKIDEAFQQAKQMEKSQIIKAWEFGFNDGWNTRENDYNPNYHKKGTGESYYDWEFNYEYGKIKNK